MALASFWRKQLLDLIQELAELKLNRRVLRSPERPLRLFRANHRWRLGALGLFVLILWNWKLVLATGAGVGAMLAVYWLQQGRWQVYRSRFQQFFKSSHRQFTVAASSGGLAALLTYGAASIWAGAENRWLATGAIFQGLGTLLTVLLLSWQILDRRSQEGDSQFDCLLNELTHGDPLRRAIAVRKLTRLAIQGKLSDRDRDYWVESIHLLLAREPEKLVRNSLIDALQRLDPPQPLNLQPQSPKKPLNLDRRLKTRSEKIDVEL
ncbi:MAG: ATP synthase subunit I [Cyanobacteriota bacterium]|nr:ATP synthase subunit I [Cyanobacteriota bacterium]